jgi:hypothetical protein
MGARLVFRFARPVGNRRHSVFRSFLFGNGLAISNASTFPGAGFTSFSFGLTESDGWRTYSSNGAYGGSTPSQTDFQFLLANLTHVGIMMDWVTGLDRIDLANVSFGPAISEVFLPPAAFFLVLRLV